MRSALLAMTLPLVLLAGCKMKVGDDGGKDDASVSIGSDGNVAASAAQGGVSVSVPGFEAKVNIPNVELGGADMDIDGMKLYPGTKLSGINVTDRDGPNNGVVDMRFTSPGSPDKIAAYYAQAARAEGFTDIKVGNEAGTATMTGLKSDGDLVTISATPAAGGSAGRILIKDRSE